MVVRKHVSEGFTLALKKVLYWLSVRTNFLVFLCTPNSDLTKKILTDNHYKTIYDPVRIECFFRQGMFHEFRKRKLVILVQ